MNTTVGIFTTGADAERAVENLRSMGLTDENIDILSAKDSGSDITDVPTTETEQPGMGKAVGGVVGGALGAAGGMSLGAAAASLLVPGVGPVMATGIIGAALLGLGGAVSGAAAGEALEDSMAHGLPVDEAFVYEDALRQGRTVVIALTDDDKAEAVRRVFDQAGAESVDKARDDWWVGLRDAEEADYRAQGGDFSVDEPNYRRGFESALHPERRGRAYDEVGENLRSCYGSVCDEKAFRRGYERGQSYHRALSDKGKG